MGLGCNKLLAKDPPAPAVEAASEAPPPTENHAGEGKHDEEARPRPSRYGVPFAWEISPEEPLAKARTFMAEVLRANDAFMSQGRSHFAPFADAETPRATVLTCSDSRVQAPAWDSSPENDDYTVRNFGNQLSTALGSVQYGIDRLHTPILLIIGHTGCEAVKSALEKKEKGKDALESELARLELPERHRHVREGEEWSSLTKAVVANVDAQVADAVDQFAPQVQSGELTVVGAVYDFQNEFDDGPGRLRLVNVNGNIEPARVEAFRAAVKAGDKSPTPTVRPRRAPDPVSLLIDRTGRPLPGGPRATINAVSILGSGNFDPVSTGSVRQPILRPGSAVPGTSDLKVAPGYRPPGAAAPAASDAHGALASDGAPASTPSSAGHPPKDKGTTPSGPAKVPPPHGEEHEPAGHGH